MEVLTFKHLYIFVLYFISVESSLNFFGFESAFENIKNAVNSTRSPPPDLIQNIKNGTVEIQINDGIVFFIITKEDGTVFKNVFETTMKKYVISSSPINCGPNRICLVNSNFVHTVIETDPESEIITVYRKMHNTATLTDCFHFENEEYLLNYPTQFDFTEKDPYIPMHYTRMSITERYWLSRKGVFIVVNESDPLFVDLNHRKKDHLCLIAKNQDPYRKREKITLHYKIGMFNNPKSAHLNAVNNFLGKPKELPDERMIKYPIWSTKNILQVKINDLLVGTFAEEILANGYNNSQLEIDDKWESCYGSMTFDTTRFYNLEKMISVLKKKGFRITLWVHPFINKQCETYSEAYNNKYLVHSVNGRLRTSWWQGNEAAVVDFTNPRAVKWWFDKLKNLQKLGIDSFKFDAGETSYLPQVPALNNDDLMIQPGIFTRSYVKSAAKLFGNSIEVRTGWGTQSLPIFLRMLDKDSDWSIDKGLPSLVTNLLEMNLNGYIYVLPDMVGGNGNKQNENSSSDWPSKNLLIRWMQASALMPSVQISYVPWDYDEQTNEICRKYVDLHTRMAPKIIESMKHSMETGTPLNPPIWWIDPENVKAYEIDDEYLLGEKILVAPVIEKDALKRDIYLPSGRWEDANDNTSYIGPTWLKNYPAPLNTLPFFNKVS